MFTCPRCGSHSFRSITLPDGSIERECRGQVVAKREVSLTKPEHAQALADPGVQLVATQARMQHARPCTFVWSASDDHLYGVDPYHGVSTAEEARTEYQRLLRADDLDGETERNLLRLWPQAKS